MRSLLSRTHGKGVRRSGLVLLMLTAIVMSIGLCACSSLPLHDHSRDAADVQGEWQVSGTMMTLVITSNQIRMPGDTNYDYTIDVNDQTMTFSVGSVSGTADYTLVTDKKTGVETLTLTEKTGGADKSTSMVKLSDDITAQPSIDGGDSTFAVSAQETA